MKKLMTLMIALTGLILTLAAMSKTQNLIWVYVCDGPFTHNHSWQQHEEPYQEGDYCSTTQPGASTGFVRCSASTPTGNPGEPPEGMSTSAPVSILD